MNERSNAILRDVRHAAQSLRRAPGLSLIAIVTLGLGIGANTAMFSVLDGYLLRPSPYPDSGRLDRIYRATPQDARGDFSPADYLDVKAEARNGYGEIAAYAGSTMSLSEPGRPAETAYGMRASANLFTTLGSKPAIGRGFRAEEETPGNDHVLVLSHRYWQVHFGGGSHIVGHRVRIDGTPYEIVGVLPANFSDWRHLDWVDLFRPLSLDQDQRRDRSTTGIHLVGRRSGDVSRDRADAYLAGFGQRLAHDFPTADAGATWRAVPIDKTVIPPLGAAILGMLVGLSGFVLLIACSNLANLLLARTMSRARELAVRAALGASRLRMLRPLVLESLLLALAGGLCSLIVARWTFDWIAVHSRGDSGVGVDLALNWHVLGWAFAACLFTALAFGVAPAFFADRLDLNRALKSGGRGTTGDPGHRRFRNLLIVAQFALAMVLLAGASLFVGGLHELNNRRHGWESNGLVTGTIVLPDATYPSDGDVTAFQRRALERIEALPGVASASLSYAMPFFGLSEPRKWLAADRERPEPGHEPVAAVNGVTSHYFESVGTRLLIGRTFGEGDTADAPRVFLVNRAMAHGLFGHEGPIGRRIAQAGGQTALWGTIVGVVGDVQSVYAEPSPVTYQIYLPMAQEPRRSNELAVRTTGAAPTALVEQIRTTMMSLDADLPVRALQPAAARIARVNYQDGVLGTLLSTLALLGLGLASLGVYGVVSRAVAQRTSEFGIRLALGARAADIVRLVLGSGARLALVGCALGLVGAFGIARFFATAFPGMHMASAPVLTGVTVLLIAIALLASYVPARYASRINPTETLRAE